MAKKKTTKKQTVPAAKPKGRPQGSQNHPLEHAEGALTRCPRCNSTERAPYSQRHVQRHAGLDAEGRPYTHIVRRRTHCLTCGQHRVDRHFEYSPPKIEDMRRGVHDHLFFGEGEIDFPPVLATLHEIGYDGLVSVELTRHSHTAHTVVPRALDFLRTNEHQAVIR